MARPGKTPGTLLKLAGSTHSSSAVQTINYVAYQAKRRDKTRDKEITVSELHNADKVIIKAVQKNLPRCDHLGVYPEKRSGANKRREAIGERPISTGWIPMLALMALCVWVFRSEGPIFPMRLHTQ